MESDGVPPASLERVLGINKAVRGVLPKAPPPIQQFLPACAPVSSGMEHLAVIELIPTHGNVKTWESSGKVRMD